MPSPKTSQGGHRPCVKKLETVAYLRYSASSCKSLQPQFSRKKAEVPPTFQRAFFNRECGSSNPPRSARQSGRLGIDPNRCQKSPAMGGFCNSAGGLHAPDFTDHGPKSRKVSGSSLEYSRFRRRRPETRFDLHCAAELGVQFENSRPRPPGEMGCRTFTTTQVLRYCRILDHIARAGISVLGSRRQAS